MTRATRLMAGASNNSGAAIGTIKVVQSSEAYRLTGWIPIAMTGTTAQRPAFGDPDIIANGALQPGVHYYDTTIGALIISDGSGGWRSPVDGSSV